MNDTDLKRLARKRTRLRKHGTLFPFCCLCGEHHWAVRYELHHVGERRYDPRTIRLCKTCHDKVTDMQKDFPPIPTNTEPRLAKLIALTRGRIIIATMMLELDQELHGWLTGAPILPPPPKPNAGGDHHAR